MEATIKLQFKLTFFPKKSSDVPAVTGNVEHLGNWENPVCLKQ